MNADNAWPETVVIWGAGAVKHAGLLATQDIAEALTHILDLQKPEDIDFAKVFSCNEIAGELKDGFKEFIRILAGAGEITRNYDLQALRRIAGPVRGCTTLPAAGKVPLICRSCLH